MAESPVMLAAALAIAAPVSAIIWFEAVYLWFGATGEEPSSLLRALSGLGSLSAVMAWSLRGAGRPAQVVRNGCQAGLAAAIALPIVTIAVLLLWESAGSRRDLGMGGLMLYSMPVVAFAASIFLVIAFGAVRRLAERRLRAIDERSS